MKKLVRLSKYVLFLSFFLHQIRENFHVNYRRPHPFPAAVNVYRLFEGACSITQGMHVSALVLSYCLLFEIFFGDFGITKAINSIAQGLKSLSALIMLKLTMCYVKTKQWAVRALPSPTGRAFCQFPFHQSEDRAVFFSP